MTTTVPNTSTSGTVGTPSPAAIATESADNSVVAAPSDIVQQMSLANMAAHTLTTTCRSAGDSPSGATIVVENVLASGMQFRGGIAAIQGSTDRRMVIKQEVDILDGSATLTILSPFTVNPVGRALEVRLGKADPEAPCLGFLVAGHR